MAPSRPESFITDTQHPKHKCKSPDRHANRWTPPEEHVSPRELTRPPPPGWKDAEGLGS